MKILFGLAFLLCISVVYALKCNACVSLKSWDDCKSRTVQGTCTGSQDRCVKAHVDGEASVEQLKTAVEGFVKGCATASDCSAKNCTSIDPSLKITKCKIDCCKGDLCNGAQVPMVSAIMLLACAIAAFAR
ncbi:unnamed protein product [Porites lobata]|uniref:UPAR/Ly6 domain-containing protein n=1 Tax=Porites lobata TaxID=104759 RepID=A0ABN8PEK8_9CNID|nr:unnamed protein product [Porites lobata]